MICASCEVCYNKTSLLQPIPMPWPEYVTLQFELVNKFTTEQNVYYGPFNALLNNLFPASEY